MSAFWLGLVANGDVEPTRKAAGTFAESMRRRGLEVLKSHAEERFSLCLAGPTSGATVAWLELPAGGFLAAVGALLYDGVPQLAGLQRLARDLAAQVDPTPRLAGNFVLIQYAGGRLTLRADHLGYYQIYTAADGSIFSSSLLACLPPDAVARLCTQALYEYVLFGFCFGRETLFHDVSLHAVGQSIQLLPQAAAVALPPVYSALSPELGFVGRLEEVRTTLLDYFGMVSSAFDGSLTCALSGGYDSRLMLATLRALGCQPRLYVYGADTSPDVRIAKTIARGEGLALEHVDKSTYPIVPVEQWQGLVARDWEVFDGLKATGIFDNGSDYATRRERAATARLQLNGAGGEIYREIWHLPNRKLRIQHFLHARYDAGDYSFCTDRFHYGEFYSRLVEKVRDALGIARDWISREELEMLFPLLRNRFAAANTAINNQWGPALLPFMEPRFVFQSYQIPIREKELGRFNSALIRSLDPALARYPSAYGHDFAGPMPLKLRLRTLVQQQVPVSWRLSRRRGRYRGRTQPYYLGASYCEALFGKRPLAIREFLDPDRIHDPIKRARALTVELLIGGHLRQG